MFSQNSKTYHYTAADEGHGKQPQSAPGGHATDKERRESCQGVLGRLHYGGERHDGKRYVRYVIEKAAHELVLYRTAQHQHRQDTDGVCHEDHYQEIEEQFIIHN